MRARRSGHEVPTRDLGGEATWIWVTAWWSGLASGGAQPQEGGATNRRRRSPAGRPA